jgi:hypothetical protein
VIEFRLSSHVVAGLPAIIEVWSGGKFVASIYGMADARPTLRVLSKHPMTVQHGDTGHPVGEVRITIDE